MADLSEYAKREAEREYPRLSGVGNATQAPFINGILHLAGRLADDDVIEAGVRGAQVENRPSNDMLNRDQREAMESESRAAYRALVRAALAAMLAKIAESGQETGS